MTIIQDNLKNYPFLSFPNGVIFDRNSHSGAKKMNCIPSFPTKTLGKSPFSLCSYTKVYGNYLML